MVHRERHASESIIAFLLSRRLSISEIRGVLGHPGFISNLVSHSVLKDPGLIQKLSSAGIIEKRVDELRFSDEFCRHLVAYNRAHGFKGSATLETWREILNDFNKSLESISDKDVATTIVLLDYFLDKLSNEKA